MNGWDRRPHYRRPSGSERMNELEAHRARLVDELDGLRRCAAEFYDSAGSYEVPTVNAIMRVRRKLAVLDMIASDAERQYASTRDDEGNPW